MKLQAKVCAGLFLTCECKLKQRILAYLYNYQVPTEVVRYRTYISALDPELLEFYCEGEETKHQLTYSVNSCIFLGSLLPTA